MKILESKLQDPKYDNTFTRELIKYQELFKEIYQVCGNRFSSKIGSYLFNGKEYRYYINMYDKQKLLFDTCKNINTALEIGTYMGHSLMLMLIANPKLKITCIDIDPTYSAPATSFLQTCFPESEINFICGNSTDVLPTIKNSFDFFHIDGKHHNKIITEEFFMCKSLNNGEEMQVIFDDSIDCQPLLLHIRENYSVLEDKTPGCEWTNTYMRIKI